MGLDIVEMVMELEERFGVEITDEQLQQLRTVGELHALIRSQLAEKPSGSGACFNLLAFCRLRGFLAAEGRYTPGITKIDTPLEQLFPLPVRCHDWRRLRATTGLTPPPLVARHPGRHGLWVTSAAVITYAITVALFWKQGSQSILVLALPIAAAMVAAILAHVWLARRFDIFAPDLYTFRDLVRALSTQNVGRLAQAGASVSEAESWSITAEIVTRWAGRIPDGGIRPEHALLDDLYVGG
jgi:hypothetical protein